MILDESIAKVEDAVRLRARGLLTRELQDRPIGALHHLADKLCPDIVRASRAIPAKTPERRGLVTRTQDPKDSALFRSRVVKTKLKGAVWLNR